MRIVRQVAVVAVAVLLGVASVAAQGGPRNAQRPPIASAKPYKPVAITAPQELNDPGFEAFRKQLSAAAQKKDRAALGKLTVSKGFFWDSERGDRADKKKSGIDNLATALGLSNSNGVGWDMLASYADDPTASASPQHKAAMCGPADPGFDLAAFDALLKATQTDVGEWGYPISPNVEAHAAPGGGASLGKLPLIFVRVMPEEKPVSTAYVRILLPEGKAGYVMSDSIAPIGSDQLCYVKDGNGGWKIGGYIGAGDAQ